MTFRPLSCRRRASGLLSTRNSTSKLGSRISSSILMASSVWQTARHLIRVLAPARARHPRHTRQTPIIRRTGPRRVVMIGPGPCGYLAGIAVMCHASGIWPLGRPLPTILAASLAHRSAQQADVPSRHRAGHLTASRSPTGRASFLTDLTRDDFEIIEDGKTQTICNISRAATTRERRRSCTSACCSTPAAAWTTTSSCRGRRRSSS